MTSATRAEIDATPEVQRQLTALDESFSDPLALDADTVRQALEASHGKVVVAARALGLKNRWVLYRLMERLDIRP
jgi:transcriptional regulator with GAF, ATPase, and Fis domain